MGRVPRRNRMKALGIAHIGIAVSDMDGILKIIEESFGLKCNFRNKLAEQGIEIAKIILGDSSIELLKPLNSDSVIQKFIDKRGAGLHHISLAVDDVEAYINHLENSAIEMIDKIPRTGADGRRIAFIHPKSMGGILIELEERHSE